VRKIVRLSIFFPPLSRLPPPPEGPWVVLLERARARQIPLAVECQFSNGGSFLVVPVTPDMLLFSTGPPLFPPLFFCTGELVSVFWLCFLLLVGEPQ